MKVNEKTLRWLMLAVIVASFVWNYAAIFDRKLDQNGDNYNYLLLSRNLALGKGYVSDVGPTTEPHLHFPPGYPAFLSIFWRLFPDNITAYKLVNGCLLLLSLLLLFRIVRKTAGRQGHWIAFAACIFCTFHPKLLRWATILMSEMLFMTISLAIIALFLDLDLEKVRQKDIRNILRLAGICLLTAALYLVRTMGLALILAMTLSFLLLAVKAFFHRNTDSKRWVMPLLAAMVVFLSFFIAKECWTLRNQRVAPGSQNDYMSAFTTPLSSENAENIWAFRMHRIGYNLQSFVSYYIPYSVLNPQKAVFYTDIPEESKHWGPGILVIALILVGLLSMKSLALLGILYIAITFGVLMLYTPGLADVRYFLPLLPLMVAAFIAGVCWLVRWLAERLFPRLDSVWVIPVVALALGLWLLPKYYESQETYRLLAKARTYSEVPGAEDFQAYLDMCEKCKNFPEDWIFVARKPEMFYIYSDFHHALPMPWFKDTNEVLQYLWENNVDIILIDTYYKMAARVYVPTMKARPELFQILWSNQSDETPAAIVGFLPTHNEE